MRRNIEALDMSWDSGTRTGEASGLVALVKEIMISDIL